MSGGAAYVRLPSIEPERFIEEWPVKDRYDMESMLSVASLGFGLLATVVLGLSVAADYWLHTVEPYDIGRFVPGLGDQTHEQGGTDGDTTAVGVAARGAEAAGGLAVAGGRLILLSTHSGLWRICVFTVNDQPPPAPPSQDNLEEDSEYVSETMAEEPSCSNIDYFGQGFERIDGGDTSVAILRGIRKATPVILVSMVLMVIAEALSIMGFLRQDYRTILGGVVSIISALSLVLGQIFYISVVNDEVSQWKKPENAGDGQVFSYGYGWAFYAASSSFLCAMVSAVGQITLYLSRYSGNARDMVFVVPGLNTRKLTTAETPLSAAAAGQDADWPPADAAAPSSTAADNSHSVIF